MNVCPSHHGYLYITLDSLDVILRWRAVTSMSRTGILLNWTAYLKIISRWHSFGTLASRKLEWIMNQHGFMLNTWILHQSFLTTFQTSWINHFNSPRQPLYRVESDFHADPFIDSDHGDLRSAPSDMLKLNSCNCDLILDTVAWQILAAPF